MPNAANKYAFTINSLLSLRGKNCRAICSKPIANSALERENFDQVCPDGPSGKFGGFEEQASMAYQQHKVGTSITGKSTKGRFQKDNVCRRTPFRLFHVHPAKRYWKEAKNHSQCLSNVYYTLAAPNQKGFDSFILHNNILYLFQFTNAVTHGIKDFFESFETCTGLPARKHWRFIFVIPSDTETAMKCPVPVTNALQQLVPYSAGVAVTIKRNYIS